MAEPGDGSETTPKAIPQESPIKGMFDRMNSRGGAKKDIPEHWISEVPIKTDTDEAAVESARKFAKSEDEIIAAVKEVEMKPHIPTMEEAYLDKEHKVRIRKFIGKEAGGGIKIIAKHQDELLDSSGRGGGEAILHEWPDNDAPKRLGVNSINHLVVAIHSDEKTRDQYEELVRTDPQYSAAFAQTSYFFDNEGHIAKLSSLPTKIEDDREPFVVYPYRSSSARDVVSEMTSQDFEIVDAALTVLRKNLNLAP